MATDRLKRILLLAGSFAISYNAAIALHELGHVLANWAAGGTVERIVLHPFSWSYTFFGEEPSPRVAIWGGAVFSSAVGAVLIAIVWRTRNPKALPLLLLGVITGALNGVYLTVDCLATGGGDGTSLVHLGTPRWLVVGVGLALALSFILMTFPRIDMLGLRAGDPPMARIATLLGGFGPYLAAMLIYHVVLNPAEISLWAAYVGIGAALMTVVALAAGPVLSRWHLTETTPVTPITWTTALSIVGAGGAIIVVELLCLSD